MKHFVFIALIVVMFSCKKEEPKQAQVLKDNTKIAGQIFGTTFSILYDSNIDYSKQVDSLFAVVNQSMSTYIPDSDISRINRNETQLIDEHFKTVLFKSIEIFDFTNGAFDPTIGAVVNAWDFGPEGEILELDSLKINSLMTSVGLGNVYIKKDAEGYKIDKPEGAFLDFNAIAKGYGVDVIGEFLEHNDIKNYLVEIGGEIRAKGINMEKNMPWRVGLDQPRFDGEQSVLKAISLSDVGMATSGTYRKFKTDDNGNRYAHIINTKTGYPSKTNILSVSVIAKDCMTADGYATAFQAMGIEKVTEFLKSHSELKVFLVFENDEQELETLSLNGFAN